MVIFLCFSLPGWCIYILRTYKLLSKPSSICKISRR